MVYFRCTSSGSGKGNTVIVTCAEQFAGVAITIAKIGKSYTKVCPLSAPYVVKFYGVEAGTYTVSATVSGQTYSAEVVVQDVSCVLNYGFTWKTWVDTAQYLDSTDYASLSEVLADEEAVRELFTEHACVDYMADSGSSNADLETIIENDLCAKWINNSDYALDYLGANVVIKALMDTADKYGYGEWVITDDSTTPPTYGPKGNVPVMTANNAPYGTALVFGGSTASGNEAYKAFDGNDSTECDLTSAATTKGVGYHFANPIEVKRVYVFLNSSATYDTTLKVQYSDDGTNYVDAYTDTYTVPNKSYFDIPANGYHPYWKAQITVPTAGVGLFARLQFYGRELKVSVPTMTSNTAPFGEASASSTHSDSYLPYKAFDGDASTSHNGALDSQTDVPTWLMYKFPSPVVINAFTYKGRSKDEVWRQNTYKLQGSNDGADFTDVSEVYTDTDGLEKTHIFSNTTAYEYYRLYHITNATIYNGYYYSVDYTLQLYGKDYSEKEFEVGTTKKWLYDHGLFLDSEVMSTANGWTAYNGTTVTTFTAPTVEDSEVYMDSDTVCGIGCKQSINLSDYSYLFAKVAGKTINSGSYGQLGVYSAKDNSNSTRLGYISLTEAKPSQIGLDISAQNTNAYCEFFVANSRAAWLNEFWLE